MCGGAIVADFLFPPIDPGVKLPGIYGPISIPSLNLFINGGAVSESSNKSGSFEVAYKQKIKPSKNFFNFKHEFPSGGENEAIPTLKDFEIPPLKHSHVSQTSQKSCYCETCSHNYSEVSNFMLPAYGDAAKFEPVESSYPGGYFDSDHGSNSFDGAYFPWGHEIKTPEISSVCDDGDESVFVDIKHPVHGVVKDRPADTSMDINGGTHCFSVETFMEINDGTECFGGDIPVEVNCGTEC